MEVYALERSVVLGYLCSRAQYILDIYSHTIWCFTFSGSASSNDAGGMYSSNFSGSYMSRGSDVSLHQNVISSSLSISIFVGPSFLSCWFPQFIHISLCAGWWKFIFITLLRA